ncbi:MAG TPA: cation:proton antiporter, partial [Acidimicrobiales bacterium]|nr:cation:proton antiporter [Acidimicrobiales bacterium]
MSSGSILIDILVVLVAAKVAAELAERVGVPGVLAEIVAGVLIGPSVLGLVEGSDVLHVLAELGAILLLLDVGMELDLPGMRAVGRSATAVAVIGVLVPFGAGAAVSLATGSSATTAVFIGAALTATSVGITARVFGDLRALARSEARTVIAAAVVDDVLGLVILTVVVRLATTGHVDATAVLGIIGLAVGFLAVSGIVGLRLAPPLFGAIGRRARAPGTLVALGLAFALGVAVLASAARLAPIIGAFVAGLALARAGEGSRIRRELTPIGHLLIPVFFLQIGLEADIAVLARPSVLGLAALLCVVAVAGKLVSGLAARGDRLLVGLGMVPRGEVGLIFAGLGLSTGALDQDGYAAVLLVILATTMVAPPLLRWRLVRTAVTASPEPMGCMPPGGWLQVRDGRIDLAGQAPADDALRLALEAALLAPRAIPSDALLDWFSEQSTTELRWDPVSVERLFALLRDGSPASWRLLETTGLLERSLPELAGELKRRRADPLHDEGAVLRWRLVDVLHDIAGGGGRPRRVHDALVHIERLLLAALVLETCGPGAASAERATRLAQRLGLGSPATSEVAALVSDFEPFRASGLRFDALSEQRVLELAAHLGTAERSRALYLLTLADGVEVADVARLDALLDLVLAALHDPMVGDDERRDLIEQRRALAIRLAGDDRTVVDRLACAPRGWLMHADPSVLASQARLLEPPPARGAVRVDVTPGESAGAWQLSVAARDQRGLLARITGALSGIGLDIASAHVATWGDG